MIRGSGQAARQTLGIAAAAVCFAAADTYVVVLALPDMMTAAGIPLDALQRAAPIVSGFLLGYVALLPLTGKLADVHGRRAVLVSALLVFALGSLVTASSYDLGSMVTGRFLQGLGAGALVPATLALVADLYPADRRGVPLGWVGAAQELGSVLGPLFGALVLAIATWRDIFWLNLVVGLLLAVLLLRSPRPQPKGPVFSALDRALDLRVARRAQWLRWAQLGSAALAGVTVTLVMSRPHQLVDSVTWGEPFVPWTESSDGHRRWLSPVGVVAIVLALAFLATLRPWTWHRLLRGTGLVSACLLALALAGLVIAFAGSDPEQHVVSAAGWIWLAVGVVFAAAFLLHERFGRLRLVPARTFASTAATGSLIVSVLVGAALVAALVDVPLAARLTVYPDSQLGAALLLLRFLVAVPVGAVLGGRWLGRISTGALTAAGMLLTTVAFVWMTQWDETSLGSWTATFPLLLAGFGFGLAIAPVNAAMLTATRSEVHGLASGFLVVARMVGMLAGLSILTAIGLHRFYDETSRLPPLAEVCGGTGRCDEYDAMLEAAAMAQVHAVFTGAAICAAIAAVVAIATLNRVNERVTT